MTILVEKASLKSIANDLDLEHNEALLLPTRGPARPGRVVSEEEMLVGTYESPASRFVGMQTLEIFGVENIDHLEVSRGTKHEEDIPFCNKTPDQRSAAMANWLMQFIPATTNP